MKSNARELFQAVPARKRWSQRMTLVFRSSGSRAASMVCAVLGSAGCTLTAEEFSPQILDVEVPSVDLAIDDAPQPTSADAPSMDPTEAASEASGATTPTAPRAPESDPPEGAALPVAAQSVQSAEAGDLAPPVAPEADGSDVGAPAVSLSLPVGWASVAGLGVDTTTGGGLAPVVLARTPAELVALASQPEALTIGVVGTLDVGRIELTSNKTLIGIGSGATLLGGIAISGTADVFIENVIVANLNVVAATSLVDGDGIQLQYAHHVWIEHCALRDAPDGLLDIVHGSDFVTVSNTLFFYTAAAPDPAHRFAALVGQDITNGAEDRGHLNVTWHHNFWAEGVAQALVGRFGNIHVYNNLFRSPGNDSVLSAGLESSWLVESNHFETVSEPHTVLTGSSATLTAIGNVYDTTRGSREVTAAGFVPPYLFQLDSSTGLASRIEAEVGPR